LFCNQASVICHGNPPFDQQFFQNLSPQNPVPTSGRRTSGWAAFSHSRIGIHFRIYPVRHAPTQKTGLLQMTFARRLAKALSKAWALLPLGPRASARAQGPVALEFCKFPAVVCRCWRARAEIRLPWSGASLN
jgi:hypothetical protein